VKAGRTPLTRPLVVLLLLLGPAALSASCGSSDDEIVNNPPSSKPDIDASSFGGTNGFGGVSGTAGTGTLGSGGSSGTASGSGGTAGGGTCSPDFCPTNGVATPCCVVPGVGPCGFDYGMGCQGGEPRNDI
jgi:hypothetical protein